METLSFSYNDSPDGSFGIWAVTPTLQDHVSPPTTDGTELLPLMCLDAAILGDIPARYIIPSVPEHAFPAMGVYIDRRIAPGFRYKVKVLPYPDNDDHFSYYLFGGKALFLEAIGRGYSRRLVFESDSTCCRTENGNIFWSDSHPGGVALELQVIVAGDSFHVLSADRVVLGHCDITNVMGPQVELSEEITSDCITKKIKVLFECRIRWFDYRKGEFLKMVSAIVECVKKKGGGQAKVNKIMFAEDSEIGKAVLVPRYRGYDNVSVGGILAGGLPTTYNVNGILDSEYPVIGTYVDPRIIPGFKYLVRKIPSKTYLFQGRPLKLLSVGIGYGKRISFEPNRGCLNEPDNFFWSDSSPYGYGFQPIAVEEGEILKLTVNGQGVGKAKVLHVASRQRETLKRLTNSSVEAEFEVDLICRWHFKTGDEDSQLLRVRGSAILAKPFHFSAAVLSTVQNLQFLNSSEHFNSLISESECCQFQPA